MRSTGLNHLGNCHTEQFESAFVSISSALIRVEGPSALRFEANPGSTPSLAK